MIDPRKIDAQTHLKLSFPGFFLLLDNNPINWEKVDERHITVHNKYETQFDETSDKLIVEASLFHVIDLAHEGHPAAQGTFSYIRNLFTQLVQQTTAEEKKEITPALYALLTNVNKSYLNFIGELSVLNYLKKQHPLTLLKTERPLLADEPEGTKIDFHFLDPKTLQESRVEVVNIHLKETNIESHKAIKKLLRYKIKRKLLRTGIRKDNTFMLVPVMWGKWRHLQAVANYYAKEKPQFENAYTPLCFIPCTDVQTNLPVDIFQPIDTIFENSN